MEQVVETVVANVQTQEAAQTPAIQELAPMVLERVGGGVVAFTL